MKKKSFFKNVLAGIIIGVIIAVSMTAAFLRCPVMGWLYVAAILTVAVTTAYEWVSEMQSNGNKMANKMDIFKKVS